ncbi:hypothetical protein [Pararhodospirillum oryzae]|uniref:Uncharacterized protein n=1 Tax=Pararhodospirillum oryzae TaxID=478448 RepID=A0A512HAB2_9PROT|nr:hypothetical protein [Pararhodospirillum oryzae]GEO82393.1 hypothetical protein ROR02_25240 [Pararhodospirillum oryzae]
MISLAKILFTLAAVFGVWSLFSLIRKGLSGGTRLSAAQRAAEAARRATEARMAGREAAPPPAEVELVRCTRCGTFVPRGQSCPCGHQPER